MNVYYEPWTESAACASIGGDAFYPEPNTDWTTPRKVCRERCEVQRECLDAVMTRELGFDVKRRFGIQGGMSPLERKKYEAQWLAEQAVSAA